MQLVRLISWQFDLFFYLYYRSGCRPGQGLDPLLGHRGMTWVHWKRLSKPKDALDELKSKQM